MDKNILLHLFLLYAVLLKGEASPRNERSATASGSEENASNSSAVGITQDTGCITSGQVTVNIQGGGGGVVGPQGERGRTGQTGQTGPEGPPGAAAASVGGVSFTRWGRTTCPNTVGTQLLYSGIMAGTAWNQGGSAEYQCMHQQPQFLATTPGIQEGRAKLYGTEYEARATPPAFSDMRGHNAPCSVCYTPTRTAKITIPARTSCPPSWTREYYGYLMTVRSEHHSLKVPVCVDVNAESVPGTAVRRLGSQLFFIETTCSEIPCPPYFEGAEIACAVCTK